MYAEADAELKSHIKQVTTWDEFCGQLEKSNLLLAPYCGNEECEDEIKKDSARFVCFSIPWFSSGVNNQGSSSNKCSSSVSLPFLSEILDQVMLYRFHVDFPSPLAL